MGVYFLSALVLSNLSAGVIKLIFWNFVNNFPTQIVAYLKFVQKKTGILIGLFMIYTQTIHIQVFSKK